MPTPTQDALIASINAKRQAKLAQEDPTIRAAAAAAKATNDARIAERENGLMKLRIAVGELNNTFAGSELKLIEVGSGSSQPDHGDGSRSYAIELPGGGYDGRHMTFRWSQGQVTAETQPPIQPGQMSPGPAIILSTVVGSAADETFFKGALLTWIDQQV